MRANIVILMLVANAATPSAWATFFGATLISMMSAHTANAGTWGNENWGQMYWGNNPVSAPIVAPSIDSVVADGDLLIVTVSEYAPGDDGWSTIQSYAVTCGPAGPPVVADSLTVRVSGLDYDTEYDCSVVAANAYGNSATTLVAASTGSAPKGLDISVIYSALCRSAKPAPSCEP